MVNNPVGPPGVPPVPTVGAWFLGSVSGLSVCPAETIEITKITSALTSTLVASLIAFLLSWTSSLNKEALERLLLIMIASESNRRAFEVNYDSFGRHSAETKPVNTDTRSIRVGRYSTEADFRKPFLVTIRCLRVDSSHPRIISYSIDCQHIGGRSRVD